MLLLQYNVCITYNVILILNALRIVESFCTVPQTILNVMFTILIYPNCFIYNIMAQEKKNEGYLAKYNELSVFVYNFALIL